MNKEMYTGSQVNHRILLWCSPGFGMIDVWLPVIRKLKEKSNIKIDFVFPEPSSLHLEDKDSDLFRLSEQFSDSIIYKGYSERWFIVNTLIEAKAGICFNSFDEKISHLAVRLLRGKMSRFFFLKALGRYILTIVKYFIRFKEFLTGNSLYDFKLSDDVAGILCDIIKEHKSANKELRSKFKDIHKFSMLHGIAASWLMDEFICEKPVITNRSDVTVYNMSHLEVDGYKKCFGILDKNLVHAGIPRHDKDWIEFVYNQSVFSKNRTFD